MVLETLCDVFPHPAIGSTYHHLTSFIDPLSKDLHVGHRSHPSGFIGVDDLMNNLGKEQPGFDELEKKAKIENPDLGQMDKMFTESPGADGQSEMSKQIDLPLKKMKRQIAKNIQIKADKAAGLPTTEEPVDPEQIVKDIDICSQKANAGDGNEKFSRFWYNQYSKKCELFTWTGSGGNKNNFEKLSECKAKCKKAFIPADKEAENEDPRKLLETWENDGLISHHGNADILENPPVKIFNKAYAEGEVPYSQAFVYRTLGKKGLPNHIASYDLMDRSYACYSHGKMCTAGIEEERLTQHPALKLQKPLKNDYLHVTLQDITPNQCRKTALWDQYFKIGGYRMVKPKAHALRNSQTKDISFKSICPATEMEGPRLYEFTVEDVPEKGEPQTISDHIQFLVRDDGDGCNCDPTQQGCHKIVENDEGPSLDDPVNILAENQTKLQLEAAAQEAKNNLQGPIEEDGKIWEPYTPPEDDDSQVMPALDDVKTITQPLFPDLDNTGGPVVDGLGCIPKLPEDKVTLM